MSKFEANRQYAGLGTHLHFVLTKAITVTLPSQDALQSLG